MYSDSSFNSLIKGFQCVDLMYHLKLETSVKDCGLVVDYVIFHNLLTDLLI